MGETVVAIENLRRSFGKNVALDDVSLSIPAGCVFGLVGENGAGKTTLLRHILGLLKPQQGEVRVFGKSPVSDPVSVLGQIGYLSEDRDMPDWMRVNELVRYTAAFFPSWDSVYAKELIEMFELQPGQRVKTLSRGQQARVGLLLAVTHRPNLLVLDEPSSGLDPIVRRDILTTIIRTVADEGRTVLFSSHLLDEVQRVSEHIAVLHKARLLLSSPLHDVLQSHHRLTVRFREPLRVPPKLPGALSCDGVGREWRILCNGQRDALEEQLAERNAEVVERAIPSLDEIFVARIQEPAGMG